MFEIIPAMDLIEGKCVRLMQGDFKRRSVYSDNPLDIAKRFESAGLRRLHLVDLDGARHGRITNLPVLEEIVRSTALIVDFGGGIRTDKDLRSVFDAGASTASIGSAAISDPNRFANWVSSYGADRFLLGADVRSGKLSINGWRKDTDLNINPFLAVSISNGIDQIFVTDISKDGLLVGPSVGLYRNIISELPAVKLIASGGVRSIGDVRLLEQIGCSGVIIGKAIYEGRITLKELTQYAG